MGQEGRGGVNFGGEVGPGRQDRRGGLGKHGRTLEARRQAAQGSLCQSTMCCGDSCVNPQTVGSTRNIHRDSRAGSNKILAKDIQFVALPRCPTSFCATPSTSSRGVPKTSRYAQNVEGSICCELSYLRCWSFLQLLAESCCLVLSHESLFFLSWTGPPLEDRARSFGRNQDTK